MAHAQKPDFVFRRNGRVHLNRRGRQFSRLLAAEVCASAVVMLDTPCPEVVWRVLATHSIPQYPLHFPSRASPFAITFQLDCTSSIALKLRVNVFVPLRKRLELRALCFPLDQLTSSSTSLVAIKLSEEDSIYHRLLSWATAVHRHILGAWGFTSHRHSVHSKGTKNWVAPASSLIILGIYNSNIFVAIIVNILPF